MPFDPTVLLIAARAVTGILLLGEKTFPLFKPLISTSKPGRDRRSLLSRARAIYKMKKIIHGIDLLICLFRE